MSELLASFGKPFAYQVAAYRLRLMQLAPTTGWDKEIWQAQHDRAFMVAGAMKADVLADLAAMVDKSIAQGGTLEEFRRDFRAMVEQKGWQISPAGQGTKGGEAWRTKVIYKTNMATSYAAGRMAQLRAGGYKFFVYRHGNSLEPRLQHLGWDGLVLEADHPFWDTHAPPNGWGCSCRIAGARSRESAHRVGGKPDKELPDNWKAIDPKTGAPVGLDRGWAYSPGARVSNVIAALAPKIMDLPAPLAADMVASWPDRVMRIWADAFGQFVDRALANRVEQNFMIVGALRPEWIKSAAERGVFIQSAEIAVTDKAVQHTFRGTDLVTAIGRNPDIKAKVSPLPIEWYRSLPLHLRQPRAVLLDQTGKEPKFLLIYDLPQTGKKMVIELNTYIKKAKAVMNLAQSGSLMTTIELKSLIGRGIAQISGDL